MDWDDLRTFLAIARHGTLSAAARALGVTQPTLGRRLAAMEARMGARLLQRMPGRFVLTPLGETILGKAERIEAEVLAAERAISGRDVTLSGTVRLTTVDTLAARIITPALVALQAEHPGIAIELIPDTRAFSLSKREADIAVRMSRFEGNSIFAKRIGAIAMGLYVAQTRPADAPPKLVTVLDDQSHLPEAQWLRAAYPDAEPAFQSNSREAHLWATKCGAGVAALARYRADEEPDLRRIPTQGGDLVRDVWLGVHSDMRHMPRIRTVLTAITQCFQAQAKRLVPDD
jgi:DNA-binding transcriptional LysR family regulator